MVFHTIYHFLFKLLWIVIILGGQGRVSSNAQVDDVGNTLVSLNLRPKELSNPIGGTDSEPVVKERRS